MSLIFNKRAMASDDVGVIGPDQSEEIRVVAGISIGREHHRPRAAPNAT
jgi:hypothetical protein